jgi:predicted HicB family RNase H-like nuclease
MESSKLIVRVEPKLLALFRQAARATRRNLSDWVRVTLEDAARAIPQGANHAERGPERQ